MNRPATEDERISLLIEGIWKDIDKGDPQAAFDLGSQHGPMGGHRGTAHYWAALAHACRLIDPIGNAEEADNYAMIATSLNNSAAFAVNLLIDKLMADLTARPPLNAAQQQTFENDQRELTRLIGSDPATAYDKNLLAMCALINGLYMNTYAIRKRKSHGVSFVWAALMHIRVLDAGQRDAGRERQVVFYAMIELSRFWKANRKMARHLAHTLLYTIGEPNPSRRRAARIISWGGSRSQARWAMRMSKQLY